MERSFKKLKFLLFCFIGLTCTGQVNHFSFRFDDCTYEDESTRIPGLTPGGNPTCVCGIGVKAMSLNGVNDFLKFSTQVNPLFDTDFTFDFYFYIEDQIGESDIFSLRNGCTNLDSLWALRYIHASNEILFEMGSNVSNYYSVKKSVSKEICLHRFTLVKFGLTYLVYIDNQLISNILARENIVFSRNARMSVGDSPCNIVNNVRRFKGVVDEITLYNRALSDLELKSIYKYPDQIVTPNSTIFKGQTIQLEVGESCSNRVNWSPGSSLDASDELDPIASPQKTTTYTVTLDNGTCISKDSVTIFVADKDKLDCDKLLLPKAFTPNNDGLNETFGISNVFIIDQMESFEIFDRWGAKVWETTQLEEKWDGTFKGQLLSNGMYLYKIKYTCGGEQKININNFNLLR